jgi:hypothetical protein
MPATDHICIPAETGEASRLRPRSPADVLAYIPPALGFCPSPGDLVILGADGDARPAARVRAVLRCSMPGQPAPAAHAVLAARATAMLATERCDAAVAAGYGPGEQASPLVPALRRAAHDAGIELAGFLRVSGGRYWALPRQDPGRCPRRAPRQARPEHGPAAPPA